MITSFTILQQGSTYTFLWRTAVVSVHASNRVDSCWDTTQLRPHQQHELQAAIDSAAQVTSQLHPTGANDHQRLMRLGSLLFSHLLPPALQEDIRRLPPGSPLSICTNDTELPWELLHDDQDFLALRHVVSRQLLAGGNDRKSTGARRRASLHRFNCLLIGNPNGDLPAADTEVENLLDLLETASQDARVEFLCREHASKVRVLAALASGEYELIHFACHARPGAIRLADGWLESTEIQAVLRGQPLVVVNACNSGRTRGAQALTGVDASPTAEIEGQTTEPPVTPAFPVQRVHSLAHAFLTGGAPVFWGASWPVDDAEARRLVVLFYRALLGGQPLGMALREARRGSRRTEVQTGSPDVTTGMGFAGDTSAWAAPVLYGDPLYRLPTPPMQQQPATILSVRIATSPALAGEESFEKYARRTQRLANQWMAIAGSHGGEVIVIRPDALRILFGAPVPVEDDAVRAVRAALEIRALLAASAESPQVCAIAVTSGDIAMATLTATPRWDAAMESTARHGSTASETLFLGSLFVEADTLIRQTQPGQVLLNERAQQLAQGRFPFILRLAEDERGTVLCYEVASSGDSGLLTPVPSAPSSLPTGPDDQLLGRMRELDLLSAWWLAAAQGRGQVVGIVGEAGVGKTRLLKEFRRTLNPGDTTWIELACSSTDRDTPYSLAAQLLRSIFDILPGDDAEAAAAKIEKRLAELSGAPDAANPEINLILRETLGISTSHVAEDERKARRGRLVNVLRTMMAGAAQHQPLIIAIDDLHWVDEASFELLSQVTDGIHRLGVQIVVLYRPEFQHNWFDKTYYRHLTLDQLDQGAAYDLLRALLHSEELPRGLGVLLQKTGGNPFFIQEMVKSLQESGILVRRAVAGTRDPDAIHESVLWELRAPLTEQQLPGTVERTLRVRLASLTAPTLAVLETAAVIGPQFGLPLLRRLLPDTSSRDLDAALAELEQRGFVEASWEARDYRFRHALILDAVGQIMPPSQHQAWHRRIAEVLEEQGGDIDRLAHHLFSSLLASRPAEPPKLDRESDQVQVDKAVACLLECGERSLLRNAARAAITYYQRVLLLSPLLPDRYDAEVLGREGIGDALTLLGDFDAAGTELRIAYGALHMRPLGPAERRRAADLTRRIGRVCGWRGEHGLGLEWMAEGLRGLGETQNDADRAVAALLYVHKGSVEYNRGNLDEVASDCARGLQLAQQVGQLLPAEAEAHNMLGIIAWAQGRIHEALAQYELSRTAWQALGNSYQVARVDGNMGVAYFYLAEWEQARVYHTRCKEYWEQVEDRDMLAHPCLNLGNIYLYQGNWEQAAIHFSRALALWSSAHHERFMSLGHTNLGLLAIEQEEWAKAQAQLEESYTILVGANIRDLVSEVLSALAEVALGMRSLPRAGELAVQARQSAAELKMQHEEALALRVLGRIHLAHAEQEDRSAGEFECARADLQGALAIFEEMANRYEAARTRYHLARVEFAAGHPKAAAGVLEVALATFAALGANHDHKLAEQLSGKLSQQL